MPCGPAGKGVLARLDEIAVLALRRTETGVRIVRDRCHAEDGDVVGQQAIEFVDRMLRIGQRRRYVEMRHGIGGVHARVGTACAGHLDRLAQQRRKRPFERLLHRSGVTLTLPAAITVSVVTQFDKITHRNIPI